MKLRLLSVFFFLSIVSAANAQKISSDWPELSMLHTLLVQSIQTPEAKKIDVNYDLVDDIAVRTVKLSKGNIPADYRTDFVFGALQKLQSKGAELQKAYLQKLPIAQVLPIEIEMHATLDELLGNCGLQIPTIVQN